MTRVNLEGNQARRFHSSMTKWGTEREESERSERNTLNGLIEVPVDWRLPWHFLSFVFLCEFHIGTINCLIKYWLYTHIDESKREKEKDGSMTTKEKEKEKKSHLAAGGFTDQTEQQTSDPSWCSCWSFHVDDTCLNPNYHTDQINEWMNASISKKTSPSLLLLLLLYRHRWRRRHFFFFLFFYARKNPFVVIQLQCAKARLHSFIRLSC